MMMTMTFLLYVDYTTIIAVSSVLGTLVFIAIIILLQFLR